MHDLSVARRYASAMIDVATEAGVTDRVATDLERFVRLLDEGGGDLRHALCTPVFTVEEREAVLDAILPRLDLHPLTANLLRLANAKRRLPLIADITRAYRDEADARAGRVRVRVSTAIPLDAALEAEIRAAMERVTGKSVILESQVDPSLLGGLVARVGSKVYDSSLRTRLRNIQQALVSAQVPAASPAVGEA